MKYLGSKNRIAKHILPIILENKDECGWYVEPFVGGCNLIDKIPTDSLVLIGGDSNEYIIEMWKALIGGWVPPKISRVRYQEIRIGLKNGEHRAEPAMIGWTGVACSYSGRWFEGYAGITKTKDGVRDYQEEALKNVKKQIQNLRRVNFVHSDYHNIQTPYRSIIYCDPPYKNTKKYHQDFNHEQFWKWAESKARYGHYVYVSEYEAPEGWHCVWSGEVSSSLRANGVIKGAKKTTEKLFTFCLEDINT